MGFILRRDVKKAAAGEAHHVGIADVVLRQQHEGMELLEACVLFLLCGGGFCKIHFQRHADDGLNALFHHRVGEFECTEKIASVGDCHGWHGVLGREDGHLLDLHGTL